MKSLGWVGLMLPQTAEAALLLVCGGGQWQQTWSLLVDSSNNSYTWSHNDMPYAGLPWGFPHDFDAG